MASDLNGGLIDIENCHFISKEQADTLQKGFAKEGDVLLSHKGTVGEVAVVRRIDTPYLMLTPQVTYYRVKDRERLSNEFLAQLFVADAFQANLVEVSGGGTRAYIGITEQAKLRLQLPKDVEEQQRIATCLSSLDALIIGGLAQTGNYKIDARYNKQELIRKVEKIARFSSRIRVENLDGIDLIKRCANATRQAFIYLDPPYYQKGANLYLNAFKDADHEKLARFVAKLSTPWLLSYDNHSFITNLYQSFEKRAYKLQHSTSNKIGDEVLVFSKKTKFEDSLGRLSSVAVV